MTAAAFASEWDYPIWIQRSQSADALYRFERDGKAGYIDVTGRVLIPPKLPLFGNFGAEFHDGLLEIDVGEGKYVDRTGKIVLDKNLYRGWDFSEGLAVAMRKGENVWGYINTRGDFVIPPRFATAPNGYVYPFSDGFAMIEVGGLYGYIDRTGAFAIEPQFLDGDRFVDGIARVVLEGPCVYFPEGPCGSVNPVFPGVKSGHLSRSANYPACKFGYIDKSGRAITSRRFDYARDFSEDLAPVRIGNAWGFIDRTGAIVIEAKFQDADCFSSGLSRVRIDNAYGYIDKTGRIAIPPRFREAETFSEGLAVVGDNKGHYWYIGKRGTQAFPGEFAMASRFFKGLAHVKLLHRPSPSVTDAYLDTKGRQVFTY